MGEHTPGEWTVSPDFPLCVYESDGRKVDPIAYAVPYRPADFKLAEVEANARLIAAAPELLGAAKKVWDSRVPVFGGTEADPDWAAGDGFLQLRNAIEKAEGGP